MAQMSISLNHSAAARNRALWVPREHGAWGMLLVPLFTGAAAASRGGDYLALVCFTVAAVSLFWLRTPVESLLGTSVVRVRTSEDRRAAITAVGIISTASLFALTLLFWGFQHLQLIVIGGVAGLAFAAQALLKKRDRRYRALAQVIGAIGLTSTAASAFYLVTGKLNSTAIALWAVNWLFAAEQIEFVQMRIRGSRLGSWTERIARGRAYMVTIAAITLAIVALSVQRLVPILTLLAFAPAIVRAIAWFSSRQSQLDVHKLGWLELANAVIFATILVTLFRIS